MNKKYLVSEDNEAQVIHIVDIILIDINPVHVHEDVSYHHHRCLMVIPSMIQSWQEVVIDWI